MRSENSMHNDNYKRCRRQYQTPTLSCAKFKSVQYAKITYLPLSGTSYLKAPIMLSVKLNLVDDSDHSNQCKSVHKNDVSNLFYLFNKIENCKQMPL